MSHRRRVASLVAAAVALLILSVKLVSCGSDSSAAKNCRKVTAGKLTLVARDVAWNTSCIDAKAGTIAFTIENKDSVSHNLRISGNGVNEKTPLQVGPVTQRLSVDLKPGTYTFVCDSHANMEGKLTVTS